MVHIAIHSQIFTEEKKKRQAVMCRSWFPVLRSTAEDMNGSIFASLHVETPGAGAH